MSAHVVQMENYQRAFDDFASGSDETNDRDLIASILLDAVEQSFISDQGARRWLSGIYAQSLLLLLDISPEAALEHLQKKWQRIDERVLQ